MVTFVTSFTAILRIQNDRFSAFWLRPSVGIQNEIIYLKEVQKKKKMKHYTNVGNGYDTIFS